MRRLALHIAAGAAISMIGIAYFLRLATVPPALSGDEVEFANHALSIATTGADLNGRRLPMFIQISDPLTPNPESPYWYQPFLFYVLAATLKVAPFSETTVRLPMAMLAVLNIALIWGVARRMFNEARAGWLAAFMLALTPAHVVFGRQALDYLGPLPFALGSTWCLISYVKGGRGSAYAAGALLGLGMFSYIAAWLLMPALLVPSLVVAWQHRGRAGAVRVAVGFILAVSLFAPLVWTQSGPLAQTLDRYQSHATFAGSRLSLYWDYFNPSFLFLAGGNEPTQTTSAAGVFLLSLALLIPVGVVAAARRRHASDILALTGFFLAPIPVVISLPPTPDQAVARVLLMLPFGILLATLGWLALWKQGSATRALAVVALILMPVQYARFIDDYFRAYPGRSLERFDRSRSREVGQRLIELIDSSPTPAIYLEGNTAGRASRWLFWVNARGRPELWQRTHYFNPGIEAAPGSLLVVEGPGGPSILRRTIDGQWMPP